MGLKLCALHPEKVKKFFDIEGASLKGYPLYAKDEKFQSTGKPYTDKEHLATDPLSVAPMIPVFANKDDAMMVTVWDATIYTAGKPTKEQNELWIAETLKQPHGRLSRPPGSGCARFLRLIPPKIINAPAKTGRCVSVF